MLEAAMHCVVTLDTRCLAGCRQRSTAMWCFKGHFPKSAVLLGGTQQYRGIGTAGEAMAMG
jgi:hypothetical protein